jgi:hypothetical protein
MGECTALGTYSVTHPEKNAVTEIIIQLNKNLPRFISYDARYAFINIGIHDRYHDFFILRSISCFFLLSPVFLIPKLFTEPESAGNTPFLIFNSQYLVEKLVY